MRSELRSVGEQLTRQLELDTPPVQVSYLDQPPDGVPEHPGGVPSVCTFFAVGTQRAFYAGLPQHKDCEIGAFVLGAPPEGELGRRLVATIGTMQKEGYLNPGEEARVPHNAVAPKYVAYGPLGSLGIPPTGVLLFANPRAAMLAGEAAGSAPDPWPVPMNGRPMCAIVPIPNQGASVAMSLGCIGWRRYTEIGADKMVIGIRGDRLAEFSRRLDRIVKANAVVDADDAARKAKATNAFHRGSKPD